MSGQTTLQPCGTYAAYQRHRKHGEEPCADCRAANTEYSVQYRRNSPGEREKNLNRMNARSRALVRLKAMHPGQYRALYTEEMGR